MRKETILIILIILIILYIYCYFIFPNEKKILQTDIKNFNYELLLLKQPIVIEEKILKEDKVLKIWFKYNIIYKNKNKEKEWIRNNYKYKYINVKKDKNIYISEAKGIRRKEPNEEDIIIEIKLKKYQSIIIPYKWYYYIDEIEDINIYGIHDYITLIVNKFI